MKVYTAGHHNYMSQLRNTEKLAEKMRAAAIMQAWINGFELVCEIHDELIFEKGKANGEEVEL